jgi:hypothetical protein
MEQAKRLELEILLAVKNNKTVPARKFHQLFEQDWNLYRSKFNELIVKKFLKISTQEPDICVFELNSKSESRIDELLDQLCRDLTPLKANHFPIHQIFTNGLRNQ